MIECGTNFCIFGSLSDRSLPEILSPGMRPSHTSSSLFTFAGGGFVVTAVRGAVLGRIGRLVGRQVRFYRKAQRYEAAPSI